MIVEIKLQDLAAGLVNLAREIARAETEVELMGANPSADVLANLSAMKAAHAARMNAIKKLLEK